MQNGMGEASESSAENQAEDVSVETRARSKRRTRIAVGIAFVSLLLIWLILHNSGSKTEEGVSQSPIVTVIAPGQTEIVGLITANGTLAARRELPVGSVGEGGQVVAVRVEAGQWVKRGQVLAVIDRAVQSEQASGLSSSIQVSAADARLAQANLDRALKLVDRGFISKADVDRLTATRDAANARVRVARAQFTEVQAKIRRLDIVAPADGLVLERVVEPGQVVSAGSGVLFRIAEGSQMELLAELAESELAQISIGQIAKVTPVGSDKAFEGQVWQMAPVINPQNRQGTVRIALSYAPELRPGGFASAEIATATIRAPQLPETAVLSDGKGSYVYIIEGGREQGKGIVKRRNVTVGRLTDAGIAIISGLTGQERVVVRAGSFLSEGESVTVRPAPATPQQGGKGEHAPSGSPAPASSQAGQ